MSIRSPRGRWALRRHLFDHQGGRCALCRGPLEDPSDGNLDHIRPVARGGKYRRDNLQLTHVWCNTLKGAGDSVWSCVGCHHVFRWDDGFTWHWLLVHEDLY